MVLVCVAAATSMVACDAVEPPQEVETASDATVCAVRSAGDPWWLTTLPSQTGRFHVQFQATPSANNIDAVVGLSKGAASKWTQLAAIVRFSPAGVIDVRNGGEYKAAFAYPYSANRTYFFRVDVDVKAHTYSVTVTEDPRSGYYGTLATNYAFRSEQAGVTSLDTTAVYLEPSKPGSLQICNISAVVDDTTPDGCVTGTAGGKFSNAWMEPVPNAMVARFTATPSASSIDGVVGYTLGAADAYNDFAASIRFYTNGQIEARDGDSYRATNPVPYAAGHPYEFYVMLDTTTATYSVYVGEQSEILDFRLLASNFHFRPQQVNVDTINNVSTVVASSSGQVRVCNIRTTASQNLLNAAPGAWALASFSDGRVVISDHSTSAVIDSSGRTIATSPTPLQLVAIDSDGNVYNAVPDYSDTTGERLTVQSFTSNLQPRWTRTYAHAAPLSIGSYGNGVIGVFDRTNRLINLRASDGAEVSTADLTANMPMAVAVGSGRYAVAWRSGNDGVIETHAFDGTKLWERRWTANFSVGKLLFDRGGGVVFGGVFGEGGVDFGAGWYEPAYSSEVSYNGYLVSLASDGSFRFAKRPWSDGPYSLSADGDRVAYVTTEWGGSSPNIQLYVYDTQGGVRTEGFYGFAGGSDGSEGWSDNVLVTSDSRVLIMARVMAYGCCGEPGFDGLFTLKL